MSAATEKRKQAWLNDAYSATKEDGRMRLNAKRDLSSLNYTRLFLMRHERKDFLYFGII